MILVNHGVVKKYIRMHIVHQNKQKMKVIINNYFVFDQVFIFFFGIRLNIKMLNKACLAVCSEA